MPIIKKKPLSFNTTLRNPNRIGDFLKILSKYENKVLSNDIIEQICIDIICSKLYKPTVISRNAELKKIFDSKNTFTKKQAKDILKSSPQKHKEAGFDKGWPSRFDTWYKFIKEMGFCYYELGSKIEISEIGKELINAYDANPINNQIIENIFLNSMVKFQTSTPFRMNAIKNIPLLLLLRVIKLLKEKGEDKGIHRKEISFFICWNNNNAEELCDYILKFRKKYGFKCSEDIIYEKCLKLFLDDNNNDINSLKTYIKKDKITSETVDEYIRKMRITGVISLRGNGCFLDINTLKKDKINYILDKYGDCCNITDKYEYYKYISERDNNLLEVKTSFTNTTSAKQKILFDLAQIYTDKKLKEELKNTYSKRNTTNDELLKYLDAPVRLEFLASIALVKYFKNITVIPNYSSDDEGIPTFTAKGGGGDIEFYNNKYYSLLEVTLMTGAANQTEHEAASIQDHLIEIDKRYKKNTFAIFSAPIFQDRALRQIRWFNTKEELPSDKCLGIKTIKIEDLINEFIKANNKIENLV